MERIHCPKCAGPLATKEDLVICGMDGCTCDHCRSICWFAVYGICTGSTPPKEDPFLAAIEKAVDAALGEVRRQGGPDYILLEARNTGIAYGRFMLRELRRREACGG